MMAVVDETKVQFPQMRSHGVGLKWPTAMATHRTMMSLWPSPDLPLILHRVPAMSSDTARPHTGEGILVLG